MDFIYIYVVIHIRSIDPLNRRVTLLEMYIDKLYNQLYSDKDKLDQLLSEIKVFSSFENDLKSYNSLKGKDDSDLPNKNESRELRQMLRDNKPLNQNQNLNSVNQ